MKVSITPHTFHLENTELLQYTDLPSVDMLHTIGKNSLISSSVSQGKFWEAVELMVVSSSFYSVLNFPWKFDFIMGEKLSIIFLETKGSLCSFSTQCLTNIQLGMIKISLLFFQVKRLFRDRRSLFSSHVEKSSGCVLSEPVLPVFSCQNIRKTCVQGVVTRKRTTFTASSRTSPRETGWLLLPWQCPEEWVHRLPVQFNSLPWFSLLCRRFYSPWLLHPRCKMPRDLLQDEPGDSKRVFSALCWSPSIPFKDLQWPAMSQEKV